MKLIELDKSLSVLFMIVKKNFLPEAHLITILSTYMTNIELCGTPLIKL